MIPSTTKMINRVCFLSVLLKTVDMFWIYTRLMLPNMMGIASKTNLIVTIINDVIMSPIKYL